ncbi:hypothetical protein W02_17800 [Nitrospira sp. KM1]|uniref:hypothetical protein n=1 Tax=Nitrospira sp. KM1 TaxID=1936990 RepID=UPI0013A7869E|nr:hypothetical protein [Nitrospira sp. KM1]BCA54640.1 hypothetical protein W02_17800 [Nitrospira sp. KM1]
MLFPKFRRSYLRQQWEGERRSTSNWRRVGGDNSGAELKMLARFNNQLVAEEARAIGPAV